MQSGAVLIVSQRLKLSFSLALSEELALVGKPMALEDEQAFCAPASTMVWVSFRCV